MGSDYGHNSSSFSPSGISQCKVVSIKKSFVQLKRVQSLLTSSLKIFNTELKTTIDHSNDLKRRAFAKKLLFAV